MNALGKLYTIQLPLVGNQQIDIPVERLVDDAMQRALTNLRTDMSKLPIDAVVDKAMARANDNLKGLLPKVALGFLAITILGSYIGNRLSR